MKIEYHNLYTHFILITQNRIPSIPQKNRERIEKYITGVINNNHKYILNQPEHHSKVTFAEEYDEFLKHYQKTLKWDIR